MDYFLIFGLVYLFGCMVTAVICSICYDARKDTKNEGEKNFVIDVMCWPIIVPILCIKRILDRIKQL
jgi:hypothetical protein